MENNQLITKIRALLAKAESSEFEEESAAYIAKAEQLMLTHDIDRSKLAPEAQDTIERVQFVVGANRPDHNLLNNVAMSRNVKCLVNGAGREAVGILIGYTSDLAYVQTLYASLLVQREGFLSRETKPYWENGRTFNHSFRLGFAGRIFRRLTEATEAAVKAADEAQGSPGTALVLADKKTLVNAKVAAFYPKIHSRGATRAHSQTGYQAGGAAAGRANLSGGNALGAQRRAVSR